MISDEFVVDDGATLLVPQHRHAHPAGVALVGEQIDLGELLCAVDGVRDGAGAVAEPPAMRAVKRLDHRHRDDVLEPLEHAHDHGAVRPGAGQRDIEMIAAARGGKAAVAGRAGAAVLGHPVAEARGRAHEPPGRVRSSAARPARRRRPEGPSQAPIGALIAACARIIGAPGLPRASSWYRLRETTARVCNGPPACQMLSALPAQ